MIARLTAMIAVLALSGCDELNGLILHRDLDDAGLMGTTPVCTHTNSIDDALPAEQRCVEAHCYSNNHAPGWTTAEAVHNGDGRAVVVPINWWGIDWQGTLPRHSSVIVARGDGCYDCGARAIGQVSHEVNIDDIGLVGLGLPLNGVHFDCTLLSRPDTASVQVNEALLVESTEACLTEALGYAGDRHVLESVVAWDLGFSEVNNASPQNRARLGVCLAKACAALNTFTVDRDQDGVGDVCDNCGLLYNPDQSNIAGSWRGDVCDDTDEDATGDDADNCVFASNPDQSDADNNGVGDACDDIDGDGTVDANDPCPERAGPCQDDYSDDLGACEVSGSIVGVENQTLGETIDLPGTGLFLRYASQRVPGFTATGAPERDAREFGLGGWSLNAHHHWEAPRAAGDPPRILLGSGGNFPATRRFPHADGKLIPDPSDAIAYVFDDAHRHVQTIDAISGRVLLSFEYDGARLMAIIDANDEQVALERGDGGLTISGPLGDVTALTFDGNDYLASVTQPGDRLWQLAHDEGGLLRAIAPPRVTAAGGAARHAFHYNAAGQLISDYGIDGERLRLKRSGEDAESRVDLFRAFAFQGNRYRELNHTYASRLDGERWVQFAGRRTTSRALEGAALEGFDSGHLTRDPSGGTTTVLIDDGDRWAGGLSRGRTRFAPSENAGIDPIVIDTEERVVLANDGPLGAQSVARVETTIRQNGEIQGQSTLYPTGDDVRFEGRPFVESASAEGRLSTVIMQDGRVAEVQTGELHPVRYTYDARGRITTIRQGSDDAERLTQFDYNDAVRHVIATYPNGRSIRTRLNDALDVQLVENLAPAEIALTFDYDAGGALNAMTTPSGEHTWAMSAGGRLQSYTAPAVNGQPDGSTTEYAWALNGRPTSIVEADGREIDFSYDTSTGLPTKVETPSGTITQRWWNSLRLRDTTISPRTLADGTAIKLIERPLYEHDRPIGETLDIRINGELKTLHQTVRVDRATWVPRMTVIEDATGTLQKTPLVFDDDGVLTQSGAMSITPSNHGVALPGTVDIGDMQTERTFSRFAEMDAKHIEHAGEHRYLLELERDERSGEVTGWRECFAGPGGCNTWSFEFDDAGRLTTATPEFGETISYEYDVSGRRTLRTQGRSQEALDHVDAQDRLLGYGDARFGYNATGQRISAADTPTGDWAYDYDVNGGLRQVNGENTTVEYVLDSGGRRIARREDGGALTWWMYNGLHPIAEFDANLRLRKRFYYGVTGHVPDYMTTHGDDGETERYHFVTNLVGSVVGVLDDDGEWVERTDYSPFGRPTVLLAAPAEVAHPFGFAGGVKDEATGLVRFGARDYDPFTGQWLAKDPIRFAGGDSNLYGYVGNDPVRFFDPTGLQSYSKDWAFLTGLNLFGAGISPATITAITSVTEPAGKMVGLFLLEEVAMNYATGGAFTLGKWAFKGIRKAMQARKAKKASQCTRTRPRPKPRQTCFVAGTLVAMADGSDKRIEEVNIGDEVLSKSDAKDRPSSARVKRTFESVTDLVVLLRVVDGAKTISIEATPSHPFWVQNRGWTEAGELQSGDILESEGSEVAWIREVELRAESALVYNLEVEDLHTYFVSSQRVWVHNTCFDPDRPAIEVLSGTARRRYPSEYFDFSLNDVLAALGGATGREKSRLSLAKKLLQQMQRVSDKARYGGKRR